MSVYVSPAAPPPISPPPKLPAALPGSAAPPKVSVQEYFALEQESEIRYEYVDGEMIAMPGESLRHNKVGGNLYVFFRLEFRDRSTWEVYTEGVRARVSPSRYRYPDIAVVCGEPITDGENPPALLNPNAIVEVLSPSTQAKDRDEKRAEYWGLSSLTDYVLAAQDKISVFHYARQNAKQWTATEYTELTEAVTFAALGVTIPLTEIYRDIAFSDAAESAST